MTTLATALGERAMLVNLSVSIWSARKHDTRISDQVAADHGADRSMGRYAKLLIPRDALAAVNAANVALRNHHNQNTLAWGDDGTRILPAANYLTYQEQQQRLADSFDRAVREFVAGYPGYVEAARRSLNGLFDPRDYPSANRITDKFGVRRHFMPVAEPDDFRVQLGEAQLARIRAEIEARNAELVENATRDLWQRLQDVTRRLVDRLSAFEVDPETGARQHPFRDSLIENVRDLLELMPRLDITGDARIEQVRQDLAAEVACHDPEALRRDPLLRVQVVDTAGAILTRMEGYC
jgi:hypothetical protein